MINPTDFHRMWICVPETLRQLLRDGNVLTCSHEQVQFALAYAEQLHEAQKIRAELSYDRPAYMLLLDSDQREALDAGGDTPVAVCENDLTRAGWIMLTADSSMQATDLRTEHGKLGVTSTVASRLAEGDFFAVCERNEYRDWVVYQALGDYSNGRVAARRSLEQDGPVLTFTGDNQVVFLVTDVELLLRRRAKTLSAGLVR